MSLYDDIAAYQPFNEQEAIDKQVILRALREDQTCFERSAQAHMACSIWVVDPAFEQTLLVYHNIYDSWSWIGGHADGERDLATVALRELAEETGVTGAKLLTCEMPTKIEIADAKARADAEGKTAPKKQESASASEKELGRYDRPQSPIFSLEVLTVDGHEKRGAYVSSHLHLNVTYLAVASPAESLRIKPDENSGVRWVPLDQLIPLSTEPWIRTRIYGKFLDKLHILRKEGALRVPEV